MRRYPNTLEELIVRCLFFGSKSQVEELWLWSPVSLVVSLILHKLQRLTRTIKHDQKVKDFALSYHQSTHAPLQCSCCKRCAPFSALLLEQIRRRGFEIQNSFDVVGLCSLRYVFLQVGNYRTILKPCIVLESRHNSE